MSKGVQETPPCAVCWSREPAACTAEQDCQPVELAHLGTQLCWHVRGGTGEDRVRRLFQEQASPPCSLSGHCFFSLASPWKLMDIMALPPLRCLLSLLPWLWGDLHDNLQGIKVGGLYIQISLHPVGPTEEEGGRGSYQSTC